MKNLLCVSKGSVVKAISVTRRNSANLDCLVRAMRIISQFEFCQAKQGLSCCLFYF